jgi:hypothetical protein
MPETRNTPVAHLFRGAGELKNKGWDYTFKGSVSCSQLCPVRIYLVSFLFFGVGHLCFRVRGSDLGRDTFCVSFFFFFHCRPLSRVWRTRLLALPPIF